MYTCVCSLHTHTHTCSDNSYLKLKLMQTTMFSFTFYCELAQFTKDWARQTIIRKYRYYFHCGWTCVIDGAAKGISSNNTQRME